MNGLEEQADNAQARDLYWKSLSWLGTIRPTSANDAFDPALWTNGCKALRQRYAGTRFEEQRQLHLPQKHKATVPEPALRVEMNVLEEQADNSQARDLYWTPLSWLGTIRLSSANDAFDPTLWATFVSTTLGLEVPVLSSPPQP
jgi:hypothetical protein